MELKYKLASFAKKVKIMDHLEKVTRDKTKTTIEDVSETLDVNQLMVLDVLMNYSNDIGLDLRQSVKPKNRKW
jgi:hypothetical protein